MSDYEGNGGDDLDNYGVSSPQPRTANSHGGADDFSDSRSQVLSINLILNLCSLCFVYAEA